MNLSGVARPCNELLQWNEKTNWNPHILFLMGTLKKQQGPIISLVARMNPY